MTKKRGYSREFKPQTERRVSIVADRVPPTLKDKVMAKCRREGVSLRRVVLGLLTDWTREGKGELTEPESD